MVAAAAKIAESRPPLILDARGRPMAPSIPRRPQALNNPMGVPYDSADIWGEHMAAWQPYLWSPDTELNMYRDRMVSRFRDAVRNDGWASGGVTRILDSAIGANFRPVSKPDHRWLKMHSNANFDATWAHEFGRQVETRYRAWSNDPGRWCDLARAQQLQQLFYTAFRHKLVDGDALAMMRWEPGQLGEGLAHYSTCVQLIDPDRLSNPMNLFDQKFMRGGVEINEKGQATAYHIREAHQGDWYNAAQSLTWLKIPREDKYGRAIIVHDYDLDRANQHRGVGILSAVMQRLKMLIRYDGNEVDSAILNSVFGAYLESPFDHALAEEALGNETSLGFYQQGRAEFHNERKLMLGNVRIPTLYPNEKLVFADAKRPNSNFRDFEAAVLRNVASGMGISAQQLSQDWSDVNYSSARAALLEAWKTLDRRRAGFIAGFAHQIFLCWLEESFDSDDYDLPNGAPSFLFGRYAYGKARWIGPAKGWVDPVAEKEGAYLGMEMGLSTLEDEAADQGADWEDNLDQRKVEADAFTKRGLPWPSYLGLSQKPGEQGEGNKPPGIPTPAKPGKKEQ